MGVTHETNDEQAKLWKGIGGQGWVEAQGGPRSNVQAVRRPPRRGCVRWIAETGPRRWVRHGKHDACVGAGGRRRGPFGRCRHLDPMIAAARARAERERLPATFICASAEDYAFEPAAFDTVVSRFGVMFFADPVRLSNLRHAAIAGAAPGSSPGGGAENPATTAERAAAPLLPDLPARRPDAPGQFAFADGQRIRAILEDSGWADIESVRSMLSARSLEKDLDLSDAHRSRRPHPPGSRRPDPRADLRNGSRGLQSATCREPKFVSMRRAGRWVREREWRRAS